MSVSIKVPSVGESISEGILAEWLKDDGEFVKENEPLFELETDKATQEIPAPASGVLHIVISQGETVEIGDEVGRIEPDEEGEENSKPATKQSAGKKQPPKAKTNEEDKREQTKAADSLSPSVRRLVRDKNVDINKVKGSGRGGRITNEDVERYLREDQKEPGKVDERIPEDAREKAKPSPIPPAAHAAADPGLSRQRMSALRQRIARKLVASQQSTATLTTFNEADMSAVLEMRKRYKERFKEQHNVGLGFMSFFVKACVEALRAFPVANSYIDGNDIITHTEHHIGVAVSTEKGLMVPVIRDAGELSFAEIEQTINDLAAKARAGMISVDDLRGGTFTITNGGVFGSLLSTPILNPPQSAILGMHTIQKRPVVVNDEIVIRPMMYLALSYDHRLIDGREAVQFLVRVKESVENPERILLGI